MYICAIMWIYGQTNSVHLETVYLQRRTSPRGDLLKICLFKIKTLLKKTKTKQRKKKEKKRKKKQKKKKKKEQKKKKRMS